MEKRDNRNESLQFAFSKILHSLERIVKELSDDVADLMEQLVTKELSLEQERKELQTDRDTLVSSTLTAINHLKSLTTRVDHAVSLLDAQCEEMEGKVRRKEEEVCFLQKRLLFQKLQTQGIRAFMRADKESFVVMEQDLLTRLMPIHEFLKCEVADKKECIEKVQELQEQIRQTEEKWLAKEEELLCKMAKVEEEMMLVIKQNIQLQELALKTDKEKAKMKKEEKKAKKQMEKSLRRERKQKEKEEKVKSQREEKESRE